MGRAEEVLGRVLPVRVQHALRDSKVFGKAVDNVLMVGAGAALVALRPSLARDYVVGAKDSQVARGLAYGPLKRHTVDVYGDADTAPAARGILVFVHGGAWGFGNKEMYTLHALELERRGFLVLVLNYRLYPWAKSDEQAQDVNLALRWARERYPGASSTRVMGHSSGAHISMLAAIQAAQQGEQLCDGLLLLSGPFDIETHYDFERGRGVHELSFMKPANGTTLEEFRARSPVRLVRQLSVDERDLLPHIMLLHGEKDDTVPVTSTLALHRELVHIGHEDLETYILERHDHVDIHTDFMFGRGHLVMALLDRFVKAPLTARL
ncbi:Kynurenine formamidase [Hondaea fermentalgiana]|uniref:Kynurenine formamidase n=1 Tax=Hondaea fermentalgiana TaxID=2315210 RepID=A0A2R5GSH9_9STRA|nr:Kynurenine formamidase [Hondaea fermentalgiana]|eukprot:GBG32708.1 Kynurenine formamidase [Hondaea fermentalgiana]